MKDYKLFCGGEFVIGTEEHLVKNKYTDKVFAKTYLADKDLLNIAIQKAQEALPACKHLSSMQKYTALSFIAAEMFARKNHLAEILCEESAKPFMYALTEIERAANTFLIAAEECKRLPKEYISLDWTANGKEKEGLVKYFPIGIVAGISPFNFPMNLAVHKIAPAIAAGCPIVLKPASATPLSTLELAEIISMTDLPKGSVSILPMNRTTGNLLVSDARIQLLSFTGSPEIGWELKKQSSKKKVVLELGGNAGVIISKNTDLNHIIGKCVSGAFSYSGQICIHAQRFFIHPDIFNVFIKKMIDASKALVVGDPMNKDTQLSVMIDEENAKRTEAWVNEALTHGAKLLCGGKRTGKFYEPTILTNTHSEMKVRAEEIFGPVICVEPYDGTIEDAVVKINDTRFGLQCGLFSDSVNELDYVFANAEVGGVIHNDVPTLRFDQMPYGGVKDSGLGREGVKYAIQDMLESKVLVK